MASNRDHLQSVLTVLSRAQDEIPDDVLDQEVTADAWSGVREALKDLDSAADDLDDAIDDALDDLKA